MKTRGILLFMLICALTTGTFSQTGLRMLKPAITEYKIGYLASDSMTYGFFENNMIRFWTNNKKVKDVTAMFNTVQMLDVDGYIWTTQVYTTATKRYDTTLSGAPFNNNIAIYGYWHTMVSIRSDSSMWYIGGDDYNLYGNNNGNADLAPRQLSPAGMKVKKVAMGNRLLVLTTNGDVWEWNRGGSLTPVKKNLPRPAIDIANQHYDVNYAIIPDVTGSQSMGYPYVWGGYVWGYWGGSAPLWEPTSLKSFWNMTVPIKKIACNGETCHYIDSLGRMFGIGANVQAEVGTGYELVNKADEYPTPYGWSWSPGQALTGAPPVQIGVGIKWKELWASNTLAFYKYATDEKDSVYSWGRNKAMVLGNGFHNLQEALFPNALDVLVPTMVHPLSAPYQAYLFSLPVMNAGTDKTINTSNTTLSGSAIPAKLIKATTVAVNGIDTVGYFVSSYQWTKLSGPSCTITSPSSATTTITGMSNGVYAFRFKMTDNNTGTASDTIIVTVTLGPVANAGPDQVVAPPTTLLNGNGQGGIASYQWSKVSGAGGTITTPNSPSTTLVGLAPGVYIYKLTVVDNNSLTASDSLTVTVASTLPVLLTDYTATVTGPQEVTVAWKTSMEQDNSFFTIGRSADGINFTSIATINGTNKPTGDSYSYKDASPLAGYSFYRLSQTDKSGKVTYFTIKKVFIKNTVAGTIKAFPNPVSTDLQLQMNNPARGKVRINIINAAGAIVKSSDFTKSSDYAFHYIPVGELSTGMYIAEIKAENFSSSVSFLKH